MSGRTVPQHLVHKLDPDEVFLTDWQRTSPDAFTVTARWPENQSFHLAEDGSYEPLLVTETVRQLFPLLCHVGYDIPLDQHLVWESYRYALIPDVLHPGTRLGPVELSLRVLCTDPVRRRGRPVAMTMHVELLRDGMLHARARSRFTIQAPAVYRRLRADHGDASRAMASALPLQPPVPAGESGRHRPEDVLLSPLAGHDGPGRAWQLRVDTSHPKYFDHPVDHVPGMLLLEAARQATQAVLHPHPALPVAMETAFHRYVELDAPCRIEAQLLPSGLVRVTACQQGELSFRADVLPGAVPLV
ncbi:ScbA/BarX family gamma-butyrolactone biosynthesis protein [Kitasatospora sp. NPDC056138]|uniref:ScbA/BarX family gamma-butyrolactone biosynthesis protein n=1 Tax=Kitasatospora sp. NPDC056138 TaxID=3345724 RepID=UPI0035DC4BAE